MAARIRVRPLGAVLGAALLVAGAAVGATGSAQEVSRPAHDREPRDLARERALAATIDDALQAAWREQKLEPAPPVDDATWLRRLSLDLRGTIPTRREISDFLADRAPDKRDTMIELFLESRDFAENLSDRLTDVLLSAAARGPLRLRLRPWLEETVANHLSYAEIVGRLIASGGRDDQNAATDFILSYADDIEALTAVTARAFLGVQVQCAQCHDHPYDKWKQADFAGLAGFFSATRTQRVGDAMPITFILTDVLPDPRRAKRLDALADLVRPEMREKVERMRDRAQKYQSARFPDGTEYADEPQRSRRRALADWMLDPDNPWFAPAAVNRIWAGLFGKGLTEPVDDLTGSRDRVLPQLLGTLARAFTESGTDLRFLFGTLVRTRAYALDNSRLPAGEERATAERWFAAHPLRPFTAEQVLHALLRATATGEREVTGDREEGYEVVRDKILSRFRYVFSDDEGGEGDSFTSSIPQALFVMNGHLTNDPIRLARSRMLDAILDETHSNAARLGQIFLATLGRLPSEREAEKLTPLIRNANGGRARGIEDLYWALLNSTEFLTNH